MIIELKNNGDLPEGPSAYLPFRHVSTEIDKKHFFILFDSMIECVAGKKVWTPKAKVQSLISASGKISITDEAFVLLCLENYWEKWKSGSTGNTVPVFGGANKAAEEADSQDFGVAQRDKPLTRWTDARRGHCLFGGWEKEGLHRFNALCHESKNSRSAQTCQNAENEFLLYARERYGISGEKGVKGAGKGILDRDFVEVFDDFETIPATISARVVGDVVRSGADMAVPV
jgi:hypothetical protein